MGSLLEKFSGKIDLIYIDPPFATEIFGVENHLNDVIWHSIETKGRVWEGTAAKDDAIRDWCGRVSEATGAVWRYERINQSAFVVTARSLEEFVKAGG